MADSPMPPEKAAPLDFSAYPAHFSASKIQFLSAMLDTFGNITRSCQLAGVSRGRFYQWMAEDAVFKVYALAEDYKEMKKDFVESKMLDRIKNNDSVMMIFFAKTQMKDRGYVEKTEVSQTITHERKVTWFDDKPLPPATQDIPHEVVQSQTHEQ